LGLCKRKSGIPHAFLFFEYLDEEGKWSTARIDFGPEGVKDILIGRGLLTVTENQEEEALENVECGPSWQLQVERVL